MRLSAGLEDLDELRADLMQALKAYCERPEAAEFNSSKLIDEQRP